MSRVTPSARHAQARLVVPETAEFPRVPSAGLSPAA